jgi:hypothetical protein
MIDCIWFARIMYKQMINTYLLRGRLTNLWWKSHSSDWYIYIQEVTTPGMHQNEIWFMFTTGKPIGSLGVPKQEQPE